MLDVLNAKEVLPKIEAYFNLLKKTGYVRHGMTSRYLVYMFLCDFTDTLYDFFSECDYNLVNKKLVSLFSDGGCLLPYQTSPGRHAHIGTPRYEKNYNRRITEDASENKDRISEDRHQRSAVI